MHGSRRLMSIRKWKKVEELYRAGRFNDAVELGGDGDTCGHCVEYKDCDECPLGGDEECHKDVLQANRLLRECSLGGKRDNRVLPAIRKVQKLVAEV